MITFEISFVEFETKKFIRYLNIVNTSNKPFLTLNNISPKCISIFPFIKKKKRNEATHLIVTQRITKEKNSYFEE